MEDALKVYVNDVAVAGSTTLVDDTIDYTVTAYAVGARTGNDHKLDGDMYSLWFSATDYIDFDIEANRRKFTDINGVPVFLGRNGELPTGTAPILFLGYNSGTAWAENRGTATSSFTINGTPAAVTTALQGQYGELLENIRITGTLRLQSYTVSTLPTATAAGLIYVSNETGGATVAFADGTNWRRVQDRNIVS
jgi:hypothetical protein